MFRHVVMFRWNAGVAPDHAARVHAALEQVRAALPMMSDYRHGADVRFTPGNFDYVIVGDFDSRETYAAYRDHPLHQQFVTDYIKPHMAERCAVQMEFDA